MGLEARWGQKGTEGRTSQAQMAGLGHEASMQEMERRGDGAQGGDMDRRDTGRRLIFTEVGQWLLDLTGDFV